MSEHKSLLKSAGTVGIATSISRILGYVRDASLAWILGAGFSMDAFTVAYRVANLFRRLVGEGAMSAAFVPVFVEYKQNHSNEELWAFARKFFYALALVTGALVLVEIIFAPFVVKLMAPGFIDDPAKFNLTVLLTRIIAPYLLCVSLAAFLMGILNSFGHFMVPALNPICFNVSMIVAALGLSRMMSDPAVAVAIGVLIGGVLQVLMQLPLCKQKGFSLKLDVSLSHPAVRKVGLLMIPSLFGIGIVQLNVFVDSIIASFLHEGAVSQLYYADRIVELVLGIFVISLSTVILPSMSKSAASKNIEELKNTLMFSLRAVAFVSIPASVGLVLLSKPIVHVLFERGRFNFLDTENTAFALVFFAVGLFFVSAIRLIVSAFYSLQDTKTPVKVAFVELVLNVVFNLILMGPLKQGGIALATSLASAVGVFLLIYIFQKKCGMLDWTKFFATLIKVVIASGIMGMSSLIFLNLFQFSFEASTATKIIALFGSIGCSAVIYTGIALALKAEDGVIFNRLFRKS